METLPEGGEGDTMRAKPDDMVRLGDKRGWHDEGPTQGKNTM